MRRRWSEPGGDRWLKMAVWAFLIAVVGYSVFRLGSALARRFSFIARSYNAAATAEPGPERSGRAR